MKFILENELSSDQSTCICNSLTLLNLFVLLGHIHQYFSHIAAVPLFSYQRLKNISLKPLIDRCLPVRLKMFQIEMNILFV